MIVLSLLCVWLLHFYELITWHTIAVIVTIVPAAHIHCYCYYNLQWIIAVIAAAWIQSMTSIIRKIDQHPAQNSMVIRTLVLFVNFRLRAHCSEWLLWRENWWIKISMSIARVHLKWYKHYANRYGNNAIVFHCVFHSNSKSNIFG